MSEKKVDQETSIEELEKDTKFLMERQIEDITGQIEEMKGVISQKLDTLRLGVLQKTINKVIKTAFSERIDKITDTMNTQFTTELRKVILEKWIISEISNLKKDIYLDMDNSDYIAADAKMSKAQELIGQITKESFKMQWKIFENEYQLKKKKFLEDQEEISITLSEFRRNLNEYISSKDFDTADGLWIMVKELLVKFFDPEIKLQWKNFEEEYTSTKKEFHIEQYNIAETLSELKIKISEDVAINDFKSADKRWIRADEVLSRLYNEGSKSSWMEFKDNYNNKKNAFNEEQNRIAGILKNCRVKIDEDIKSNQFETADDRWIEVKKLLALLYSQEIKDSWIKYESTYLLLREAHTTMEKSEKLNDKFAFNESIDLLNKTIKLLEGKNLDDSIALLDEQMIKTKSLMEEYWKNVQTLMEYENKFEENHTNNHLKAALDYCIKIIVLSEKLKNEELNEKYTKLKDQIEKRISYREELAEQQNQELMEKAKRLENLIKAEEGVLPLLEEFSIKDLIGNLSSNVNEALNQIGGLLEEHRVEIKRELKENLVLKSESGEIFETDSVINIEKSDIDTDEDEVIYNAGINIINPFEDSIEEAVLTDLIPYNFEIMNVEINGKTIPKEELPENVLTKDGMELKWEFHDIPVKEKVEVKYDLRRRISRTIIFYLENELRIIKTHTKLTRTDIEGIYEANIPFSNNNGKEIQGLIVEDIVPLYYLHLIKEPTTVRPTEITPSKNGDLIKWEVGNLEDSGTLQYNYRLMELYKYEELKIKMSNLNRAFMNALDDGNLDEVVRKNKEIEDGLSDLIT